MRCIIADIAEVAEKTESSNIRDDLNGLAEIEEENLLQKSKRDVACRRGYLTYLVMRESIPIIFHQKPEIFNYKQEEQI